MKEKGISDISRVGLYGLTYKENVDDYRESPTLQLLECQEKHLSEPLKVYDPYIKDDIVKNQYHDFDKFLADVDMLDHSEAEGDLYCHKYSMSLPVASIVILAVSSLLYVISGCEVITIGTLFLTVTEDEARAILCVSITRHL